MDDDVESSMHENYQKKVSAYWTTEAPYVYHIIKKFYPII